MVDIILIGKAWMNLCLIISLPIPIRVTNAVKSFKYADGQLVSVNLSNISSLEFSCKVMTASFSLLISPDCNNVGCILLTISGGNTVSTWQNFVSMHVF